MSQTVHERGDVAGGTEDLTKSEFHWLFSESRCKMTLEALDELTLPVDLETVATTVAEMESDQDTVRQGEVDGVAASLHHTHLPKMDRLGVIGYDQERNEIE